jgi:SAM-dependent methyltransferase
MFYEALELAISKEMLDIILMRIYGRLSQVYDLDWGKYAKQYVSLVNQLLDERGVKRARILDIACGTGTLVVELANRGHFVHGIDISPEMINIAKSKSISLPNVSFDVQDMTHFSVKDKFELATCTFDSINYQIDTDGLKAMFHRVASALCDSGIFVFDSNTKKLYTNRHKGIHERVLGGVSFIQQLNYDPIKKEATTVFEFSDGTIEVHRQRPYDLVELKPLLAEAGLRVIHLFSGFDKRPYNSGSERLICVAEREARGRDV